MKPRADYWISILSGERVTVRDFESKKEAEQCFLSCRAFDLSTLFFYKRELLDSHDPARRSVEP